MKILQMNIQYYLLLQRLQKAHRYLKIWELKNKESDRIKEMQKALKQVGINSTASKGSLKIFGKGMFDASDKNGVPNLGDHRICMATFILAILTGAKTKLKTLIQ